MSKFFFVCVAMCLILLSCNRTSQREGFYLGTVCRIQIEASAFEVDLLLDGSFDILQRVHELMSSEIDDNDVYKINSKAGITYAQITPETFEVIETSFKAAELSGGALDISLGPLINLWNINPGQNMVPGEDDIKKMIGLVNYKNILLDKDNLRVMLKKRGMLIDLGAVAKGFAADRVAQYLRSKGVMSAQINLGGNIYVIGRHPANRPWIIGIMDPRKSEDNSILGHLNITDSSLVTSGDYQRYFIYKDKRFHHILDSKTGYPSENSLMSVTIINSNSAFGDALSTAAFVLGLKKGMELIRSIPEVEAVFVTKDKNVYISGGLKEAFILSSKDYKMMASE